MNYLFIGCGKKFGRDFLDYSRNLNHQVYHITSSGHDIENEFVVDWKSLREPDLHKWLSTLPDIDLIWFNQNGSSLNADSFDPESFDTLKIWKQLVHWKQSYYVSCQLPWQIIHTLDSKIHSDTKIIWMVSRLVVKHSHNHGCADYIGNKFQNYILMKNFSATHRSCFFAVDPGNLQHDIKSKIDAFQHLLNRPKHEVNGHVWTLAYEKSELYEMFK